MVRKAFTEPQCLYRRSITLLPPMGRTGVTEIQCLLLTALSRISLQFVLSLKKPIMYSYTSSFPMGHTY